MTYFENTEYLSNSDLKRYYKLAGYAFEEPPNLDRIFEFGTLFHNLVLEPMNANVLDPDYSMALEMKQRFYRDSLCLQMLNIPDLRIEHEYYRQDVFGFKGKCKCDGRSKALSTVLELKGLNVDSQSAFDEAIDRFDYDQGASWYIHSSHLSRVLIVAVSKKNTSMLFKKLITHGDSIYKHGVEKIEIKKRVIEEILGDVVVTSF